MTPTPESSAPPHQDQVAGGTAQTNLPERPDTREDPRPVKRVHTPWHDFTFNMRADDHKPIPWDLRRWWASAKNGRIYMCVQRLQKHPKTGAILVGEVLDDLPAGCPHFGLDDFVKIIKAALKGDLTIMEAVGKVMPKRVTQEWKDISSKAPLVKFERNTTRQPDDYRRKD